MNVYDSRKMADILFGLGYAPVEAPEGADMLILNTCNIREKASEKLFSELGRMKKLKAEKEQSGGRMVMAVAGCVAQAEGDVILDRAPFVDLVFGPQNYHELPEMVAKITGAYGRSRIVQTDFPVIPKFDFLPESTAPQGPSAFLSIQEGCDKFCTFCVVPYTRGSEYSRPVKAVLEEARRILDTGAQDITLLGQNVNAYHGEDEDGKICSLGRLIEKLSEFNQIKRIRYMTSHPKDVDDELINAHRDIDKLMPFLHLPVQHGSDAILKSMNRKHTRADYIRMIEQFRQARPDIALSSDFIIGFPGETDRDFEDMVALIETIGFSSAYSFKYSPRPGTPSANMQGLVPEAVKTQRLQKIQTLLFDQSRAFNQKFIGRTVPVLLDQKRAEGQMHGRSPYNQSVHVNAPARLFGQIVDVEITSASQNALSGRIATTEDIVKFA